MHSIAITGRLTRDPEQRYTPDGKPVCSFGLADNGDRRGGPIWFDVTCWGRLAEVCTQYLEKGRTVALVGQLKAENGGPRIWTGNDGQARASFELTAQSVEFLNGGDPQHDGGHQEHAQQEPRPYGPGGGEPPIEGTELDDEIPF
jgi:single-strand DNA-binding protein